jgi:site-specific DNA-methyltransferase (adenine-specific)
MRTMHPGSVDFVITPYITRYADRSGRRVANDDNAQWLKPAFAQMHRLLKSAAFCVSFLWLEQGRSVHLTHGAARVFASAGILSFASVTHHPRGFLRYQHEQAYLLVKGEPQPPAQPIPDVIEFPYTGNKLHPTQKPISALKPLIETFCPAQGIVLDPFAGSGSALVAARQLGRNFIGIELDASSTTTPPRRGWQRRRP